MSADRYITKEPSAIEVYGRNAMFDATLKNLSSTGACLEYSAGRGELEPGDLICITVFLSQLKKTHRLSAQVVWLNGNETGVNFLKSDELFARFREKAAAPR